MFGGDRPIPFEASFPHAETDIAELNGNTESHERIKAENDAGLAEWLGSLGKPSREAIITRCTRDLAAAEGTDAEIAEALAAVRA